MRYARLDVTPVTEADPTPGWARPPTSTPAVQPAPPRPPTRPAPGTVGSAHPFACSPLLS